MPSFVYYFFGWGNFGSCFSFCSCFSTSSSSSLALLRLVLSAIRIVWLVIQRETKVLICAFISIEIEECSININSFPYQRKLKIFSLFKNLPQQINTFTNSTFDFCVCTKFMKLVEENNEEALKFVQREVQMVK